MKTKPAGTESQCWNVQWRSMNSALAIMVAAFTMVMCPVTAGAQVNTEGARYAIIGHANGGQDRNVEVHDIGNGGDVVGNTELFLHGVGFDWYEGRLRVLHPIDPYPRDLYVLGVNAEHFAVGSSHSDSYPYTVATLWDQAGNPQGLGTLGGDASYATAINDLNHVVGYSTVVHQGFVQHAFFWHDGVMDDLGTVLPEQLSYALDINNTDQIVGYLYTSEFSIEASLWEGGQIFDLGTLGGPRSEADAINDLGQVVGWTDISEDLVRNAFLWQDGVMQSIHDSNVAEGSEAHDINNHSQVVGNLLGIANGGSRLFIWDPVNGMHNIMEFLPPDNAWNLHTYPTSAEAINDFGQIVGYGTLDADPSGPTLGFLITPVTPTLLMDAPTSIQAGADTTITIHNADPGATIHFIYGQVGGGHLVPGCDAQTGAVLQMDDPTVIGSVMADSSGDASLTVFVPDAARNAGDILLQAVEHAQCKISQLVVVQFE